MDRLVALRGAASVEENSGDAIRAATRELLEQLLERNALRVEDIVSCIFTATEDLDAEFPAVAARELGFQHVPLLCAREIAVPGSLPSVVRVMMHCYPNGDVAPQHVYLGTARALRTDLDSAQ
jgi:chorismate mutase